MGNPLFAIFVLFRATDRQTALTRTSVESVGKPGTLLRIAHFTGQRETLRIFRAWPHLRSLQRPVSLVILLTAGLARVSGDSSEAESNPRACKRVGKDKGSSAKRSNSAASPTFNICFTNSQFR